MPLGSFPPDPIWIPPETMAQFNKHSSPTGWVSTTSSPPQVIPTRDIRPHVFGTKCWCQPVDDGEIVLHKAADGRERYFEGRSKPN